MSRIVVIGGTGYAGSNIARVAAERGHEVVSYSRSVPERTVDGVAYRTGSALENAVVRAAVDGADTVIVALSPRGDMEGRVREAVGSIADAAREDGTRIGVIIGAGSLLVAPGGITVAETPDFPDAIKPEAAEMAGVLDDLRASDEALDWFAVSPASVFGAWAPGEATGSYRVGGDVLLVDEEGRSEISGADFGAAVVDEVERPAHRRARFTVAY